MYWCNAARSSPSIGVSSWSSLAARSCSDSLRILSSIRRNMARHRIRTTLWRDYKLEWPTPLAQYGTSGRAPDGIIYRNSLRSIHHLLYGTICEILSHIWHTYPPQGIGATWRAESRMKKTQLK